MVGFKLKGATVPLNAFHPNAVNYQPNAWNILRDLNFNVIRISGGIEGDLHHINISRYPAEWAQNLNAFLSDVPKGMQVYFHELGRNWGTLLGIISPGDLPGGPYPPTPIDEAKTMIDQLAGNNALNHDFITDPRILGWTVSNENDIGDPTVYDWNIQIADYIRSKGGKAWLAHPRDSRISGSWAEQSDFHVTEPLLRGHVDYLEFHRYMVEVARRAQEAGTDVYSAVYEATLPELRTRMINGRGTMPIENLILGEFGIWRGYGADVGVTATFSDENRRDYYKATLDAARDVGLPNISFHDCFAQKSVGTGEYLVPMWSVVDVDGTYFPLVADVIKAAYTPTPPPIPLWKVGAVLAGILGSIGVGLAVSKSS